MYTLYISEKEEKDREIIQMIREKGEDGPLRMFLFGYTAPYEKFNGIKEVQRLGAYRPFQDSNSGKKVIVIELKEWIGHEEEDYFIKFLQFLHDCPMDFWYDYVFTAGEAAYEEVESMHSVIKKYLGEGEVRIHET